MLEIWFDFLYTQIYIYTHAGKKLEILKCIKH